MALDEVRVGSIPAPDGDPGGADIARRAAIDEPELWAGISTIEPGATTGWHHHGSNTTVFRMISGSLRVEFGDPVESSVASAGDFVVVPAGVIHREIVDGPDGVEATVIRFGDGVGPLVVDVDAPAGRE